MSEDPGGGSSGLSQSQKFNLSALHSSPRDEQTNSLNNNQRRKSRLNSNIQLAQNLQLVPTVPKMLTSPLSRNSKTRGTDSDARSFSIKSSIDGVISEEQKEKLRLIVERLQLSQQGFPDQDDQFEEMIGVEQTQDSTPNLVEGIFFIHFRTWREFFLRQPPGSRQIRICVYDARSLFIFDHTWRLRYHIVKFTESKVFENLVLLAIMISTLLMLLQDYSDTESAINLTLDRAQMSFIVIFSCECTLKIISMGFVIHPNAYLRDPWNWIDFLVVITGLIELTPTFGLSLSALRTLRVLRPLKSLNAVPSMKKLIQGMIDSVSALFYAIIFMCFVLINFAIFGTQQFSGAYYSRCRTTEDSVGGIWPYNEAEPSLCGPADSNAYTCPGNTKCGAPIDIGLPSSSDPLIDMKYIDYGFTNFDNILQSLITIFQCITLEGWSKIMYNLQDQQSMTFLVQIFFISLIMIGTMFMLNLVLAIFSDSLDHYEELSIDRENQKKAKIAKSLKRAKRQRKGKQSESLVKWINQVKSVRKRIDQQFQSVAKRKERQLQIESYEEAAQPPHNLSNLELMTHNNESQNHMVYASQNQTELEINQEIELKQESASELSDSGGLSDFLDDDHKPPNTSLQRHRSIWNIKEFLRQSDTKSKVPKKPPPPLTEVVFKSTVPSRAEKSRLVLICYKVCVSLGFLVLMSTLTVVNCIVLAIDRFPISESEAKVWEMINLVISFTFITEMCIKLVGLGPKVYASDKANVFDAFIVAISLVEMILGVIQTEGGSGSTLAAFRAFRLLRILKLFRQWKTLNQIIDRLSKSLQDMGNFAVLWLVFLMVFIILGMQLFSNTVFINQNNEIVASRSEGSPPRNNFDSVYMSFLTVFALTIGADWNVIMYDFKRVHYYLATCYFMFVVIFTNIILTSLFLAILLSNFNEPIAEKEKDVEIKGAKRLRRKLKTTVYKVLLFTQRQMRRCCASVNFIDQSVLDRNSDSEEVHKQEVVPAAEKFLDPHNIAVQSMLLAKNSRVLKFDFTDRAKEEAISKREGKISSIAKNDLTIAIKQSREKYQLHGRSLYLLSETNPLRRGIGHVVNWAHFDNLMVGIILISSLNLALYNPLFDPNSKYSRVIEVIDLTTSGMFIVECLLKILLQGLLLNGKHSYLRTVWNQLDFFIVCISITTFLDLEGFGVLKVLRIVRVLRPLRLIHKQPGLRISIQSLLNATPRILNLLVICVFVLGIFAILGINFYKGLFFRCQMDNIPSALQEQVLNYWDCLDLGGEWVNSDDNFDNIFEGIKTQFIIMCRNGWLSIQYEALNSPLSHYTMPKEGSGPYSILYFVVSICVSSLFILNMFVGIVISTFQQEKEKVSHHSHLTKKESEYIDTCTLCYRTKPILNVSKKNQEIGIRERAFFIVQNKKFEIFIFGCISVNTAILMLHWYNQDPRIANALETVNQVLSLIFTLEFLLKIVAFGQKYFTVAWNILDFIIVVVSWLDFLMMVTSDGEGLNSSVQVVRTFRVARVLKLVRGFKELQRILATFLEAIPALFNVGGLLFLFQFLYGILGVYLFSTVKLQSALNEHANFQSLGTALVTLFRVSTGDNWQSLMEDCARSRSIHFQCYEQTHEQRQLEGIQGCGDPWLGYAYFISFMVFMTFIMLNLFIAIILEGFQNQLSNEEQQITSDATIEFQKIWTEFDQEGKGFLHVSDLTHLIVRVVQRELQLRARPQARFQRVFLFNLHRDKRIRLFTIWKLGLKCSDEDQKWISRITKEKQLQRNLNKKVEKWIGNLSIPTYNKMQNYYFHDVLIAFVKNFFAQNHKVSFMEREARIKNLKDTGQELALLDRIRPDSLEYNRLSIANRQLFHEMNSKEFDDVVRSIELKGMRTTKIILKLSQMKQLRFQINNKNADTIDKFGDQMIDSGIVMAAMVIQRFMKERRRKIFDQMARKQNNFFQAIKKESLSNFRLYDTGAMQQLQPKQFFVYRRQNCLNRRQMRLIELSEKYELDFGVKDTMFVNPSSETRVRLSSGVIAEHQLSGGGKSAKNSSSSSSLSPKDQGYAHWGNSKVEKVNPVRFNSPKLAVEPASASVNQKKVSKSGVSGQQYQKASFMASLQDYRQAPVTVFNNAESRAAGRFSKLSRLFDQTLALEDDHDVFSAPEVVPLSGRLPQAASQRDLELEDEILHFAIEMSKVTPKHKK